MNEQASAKNGVYYLTTTIDINLANSGTTLVAIGQFSSSAPAKGTNQGGPRMAKIQDMIVTRHQSSWSPYATSALAASMGDSDEGENADISRAISNKTGLAQMSSEKTTMII